MANPNSKIESNGSAEPIIPIDFTPNENKAPEFSFKLKPIHFVLVAFFSVSGFAAWFVLTAKSVSIEANPVTAMVEISGGLNFKLGPRYLIRSGTYDIKLVNEGYHDSETVLVVSSDQTQTHPYVMDKLPGVISFASNELVGARVQVDGIDLGETPLLKLLVEAGERQLTVSKDRYLDFGQTILVEGRSVEQSFDARLEPAWATVSLQTSPPGADVIVDGELIGITPMNAEIIQGQRDLTLKLAGHKAWQEDFDVFAGEDFVIPNVELEPADGLVFIQSSPSSASVTIGGEFKGLTPLEVSLAPDVDHEIRFFKNGYNSSKRSIRTRANEESGVSVSLDPVLANVQIISEPEDAELYVNGEPRGLANQTLELMAASQQIEVRKAGYVPFTTEFTSRPGLDQVIRVSLKSLEQARLEQIEPVITNVAGQSLKLFYPSAFTMGASRREAGRRSNENLREINLERPFYISYQEVTNAEFRLFDKEHSSGILQGLSLNNEAQPVIRISWTQAALFSNWLSEQESVDPFYNVLDGEVIGFNKESTGYRLPSEAEWAWAARSDGSGNLLKFPWGTQLPPPDKAGNFADVTARNYIGEIMFDYDDGYLATAPVASFTANQNELFDMAGNVSEWVHDFYGSVGSNAGAEVDPLGAQDGQFHTIRGSSWSHGSVSELRLSFRDFGEEPRDDVGFRVARYLED
ncbi:MAG: sulfatase activating formylglycine-generating enzyme [Pseudohongiellaceae bacterium]|jgi:formylglycine-generating enzyme required for sulfatase activity